MFNPNMRIFLVGIVATITMDILSGVSIKLALISPLPPRLIGRWFASVARGRPFHQDIDKVTPVHSEKAIALPVHYAIVMTPGVVYLLLSSTLAIRPRNPLIAFGFTTSALPWLVMFPAVGYGWFGADGPPGTRLFLSSLVTHGFYGLGFASGCHSWPEQ